MERRQGPPHRVDQQHQDPEPRGSAGTAAPSQCNKDAFWEFADAYDQGVMRYTLSQRTNQIAEDLAQADQIIEDLSTRIAELTTELANSALPDDDRRAKERQRDSFRNLLAEEELERQAIAEDLQNLRDRIDAIRP